MDFSFKDLKERLTKLYAKANKTSITALSVGGLFLIATLRLLLSTAANTITGDDMVFEKSYPDLSTLISSPLENYMGWTARLSNIFTLNFIFGSTPDSVTHLIALPLSLGLLGASSWFLFTALFKYFRTKSPISLGFLVSQALTLVLCLYSFSTYDNFYWIAGVVTYIFPIAILNFITGFCLQLLRINGLTSKPRTLHLLFIFTLSIIMGLYNEGFVVQVISILVATLALSLFVVKRSAWKGLTLLLTAVLLGLILSALIMKLAPGTIYREELNSSLYLIADHSFIGLLKMTFHTTLNELKTFFIYNQYGIPSIVAVTLIVSSLAGRLKINKKLKITGAIFGLLLPVIAFSSLAFAVHYAYQPSITNYSLITAYYFSYLGIIVFSFILFQSIIYRNNAQDNHSLKKIIAIIIGLIVIIYFSFFAIQRINQIYDLIELQHAEFTKTDKIIKDAKSNGDSEVHLRESVRYFTYCVPEKNKTAWCNDAFSQYYGLDSITTDTYTDVETQIKYKEGKL